MSMLHSIDIILIWCKNRHMPPKLEPGTDTERVQIVAPKTLIAKVDEWRRQQPDIPNRSEAFRRLVEIALTAAP